MATHRSAKDVTALPRHELTLASKALSHCGPLFQRAPVLGGEAAGGLLWLSYSLATLPCSECSSGLTHRCGPPYCRH
jgi:hypothetical protein